MLIITYGVRMFHWKCENSDNNDSIVQYAQIKNVFANAIY